MRIKLHSNTFLWSKACYVRNLMVHPGNLRKFRSDLQWGFTLTPAISVQIPNLNWVNRCKPQFTLVSSGNKLQEGQVAALLVYTG